MAVFTTDGRNRLSFKMLHRKAITSSAYLVAPEVEGSYVVRYFAFGTRVVYSTPLAVRVYQAGPSGGSNPSAE